MIRAKGTVKDGVIIPEEGVKLPEGTRVEFEAQVEGNAETSKDTIRDTLLRFAGSCKGLPSDMAQNHDHYLYGLPKRKEDE